MNPEQENAAEQCQPDNNQPSDARPQEASAGTVSNEQFAPGSLVLVVPPDAPPEIYVYPNFGKSRELAEQERVMNEELRRVYFANLANKEEEQETPKHKPSE